MSYSLFVSCPRNMEYQLADELKAIGLEVTRISPMGVYGQADLNKLYEICLWSRLANRVQLILFSGAVSDSASLSRLCQQYDWQQVFTVDKTMAVEFHGDSALIKNTMYGAQCVKDGVVDYFKQYGERPSVDKLHPDIRLHAYLKHEKLTVSLDMTGYSLHQRGYRLSAGDAPLKENLAAAILMRARWPELAAQGYSFMDPLCGSATLLIEAAMMASKTAPGLLRTDQSFKNWLGHDAARWQAVIDAARERQQPINNKIMGFDCDGRVLVAARENIAAAGLTDVVSVKQQAIKDCQTQSAPGLVVCNPPYGERLQDPLKLQPLYLDIGKTLFTHCQAWQAAILTSNQDLAHAIGLRVSKAYNFYNGPLKVKLYCIDINASNQLRVDDKKSFNDYEQALYNRLLKNKKHLNKWLKRTGYSCYRLYDADLPNYAFAIDVYGDWAHVQEYAPPKDIPAHKAAKRIDEMLRILPEVLGIPADHIVQKLRSRQKGSAQYQRLARQNKSFTVTEGPAIFKVNLHDYLDTGLFLDHRPLRLQLATQLRGKKFLNCFCYTASFSVHAAMAGASTCNVDLSKTYLKWAQDNFKLNKIPLRQHQFIQADCLQWLAQCGETFDVILLDPPSFSNSKRMTATLDIQRDQEALVESAMRLLAADGVLYFSTNLNKFKLSLQLSEKYQTAEITRQTLDIDFKRTKNSHHCYTIRKHQR